MGKINIPLESYNENVNQENFRIFHLQNERQHLIETILYQDSIDKLLENCLNNFKCSGIWYQDFLTASNLSDSSSQRLVAY